jgi:2-polyprenyl-3-methyl-5-hydroxy-6-metoxy-1,4-benzoquinol methylase
VNEIEYLIKEYGSKGIYFREDNFTLNRERVIGICEEIQRRKIKITWECSSRVDLVDKTLLRAMYRAGCRAIWYGIESGSPRILDILYKHITIDQSKKAIRLTREAGIKTGGSFIIGIPGETMEEIKLTLNLIKDLHCETTAYHYFYAIPVSKLYLEVKERRMIDSVYGDILFVKNDKFDRDSLTRLINQSREEIYGDQMQNEVILKVYQQIKQLIPMAVRLHLRKLKQRITNECFVKGLNLRFTQAKNQFNRWRNNFKVKRYYGSLWYEDVCKYFAISKEEAVKRATSPNRKSKLIWKNKEEIEKSERNVIDTWEKDENMVIRNSWYRERNIETRWDKMLKNLNYKKGERILDYGCGVSSFTKWALEHRKFDVTLAEIDGPMLKFCKWRYGKKVSYCKIRPGKEGLPLKEEYDIILCLDMLEHVWSPLNVVKHLCSHLNAQGRLIETFIDDSSGSNLRNANKERPLVLNYLNKHLKLISGSLNSAGPRIWMKEA